MKKLLDIINCYYLYLLLNWIIYAAIINNIKQF